MNNRKGLFWKYRTANKFRSFKYPLNFALEQVKSEVYDDCTSALSRTKLYFFY